MKASAKDPMLRRRSTLLRFILNRRVWQALFLGLAALATLIGLFYAVENWRGKRAWKKVQRQLEARGEPMRIEALLPPPVPRDQNFAMTPLLRPLFDYEFTPSAGARWRDTNGFNRVMGLSDQYPDRSFSLPERSDWRYGKPIDLKAWQIYYRGTNFPEGALTPELQKKYRAELRKVEVERARARQLGRLRQKRGDGETNLFPITAKPQEPAADVLYALGKLEQELQELHEASRRPYAQFPVHYDEGYGALLPHLSVLRGFTYILQLRSIALLELERTDEAFKDTLLCFRLAASLDQEPRLGSHIIRKSILILSLDSIWSGIIKHQWKPEHLSVFQEKIAEVDLFPGLLRGLRGERAQLNAAHSRAQLLKESRDRNRHHWDPSELVKYYVYGPRGWIYQNLVFINQWSQTALSILNEGRKARKPGLMEYESLYLAVHRVTPYNFLARIFLPPLGYLDQSRAEAELNVFQVACALEQHRIARGEYPASLTGLVPDFLEKLPADLDQQPLRYRREEPGKFVLYSVGLDLKDDGGILPSNPKERRLDLVFAFPKD